MKVLHIDAPPKLKYIIIVLPDVWNPEATLQNFIQFTLIQQLRMSGFHGFQLHCNLL